MTRWMITNTKTGAHVTYTSEGQARRAVYALGWVDCTIEQVRA